MDIKLCWRTVRRFCHPEALLENLLTCRLCGQCCLCSCCLSTSSEAVRTPACHHTGSAILAILATPHCSYSPASGNIHAYLYILNSPVSTPTYLVCLCSSEEDPHTHYRSTADSTGPVHSGLFLQPPLSFPFLLP